MLVYFHSSPVCYHPCTSLALPSLCLWASIPPHLVWILQGSVFSLLLLSLTSLGICVRLGISLCLLLSAPASVSTVQTSLVLCQVTCLALLLQHSFILSIIKHASSIPMSCSVWNVDYEERKHPPSSRCYTILFLLPSLCPLFPSLASIPPSIS